MKLRLAMLSLVATLASLAAFWVAPIALADPGNLGVTICHRTGSAGNPYIANTPSSVGQLSAHINLDPTNPPHPPKDGREDFVLPFPGGTEDDCAKADPDPK